MTVLLSIQGLSATRGGAALFADFNLTLPAGEAMLLLGPSGSGKSTLVHFISGFLTPDAGRILLDGTDMVALSAAARDALRRRTLGIVFQTLRLVSALSLAQNLRLAQRLAEVPADEALAGQLMETLGIAHCRDSKPRAMSQGEAQRAAIARALVTRPKLLIADEPTSALDDAATQTTIGVLKDAVARAGAGLLVATHDARLKPHFRSSVTLAAPRRAA